MSNHKMTKNDVKEKAWFECSCGFIWLGTYFLPKRGSGGRQAEAKKQHAIHVMAGERTAIYDALDAKEITLEEWKSQTQDIETKMEALRESV